MSRTWNASFLEALDRYGRLEKNPTGYTLTLSGAEQWPEVARFLREAGEVEYFIALTATHKPPAFHLRYDLRSILHLTDITVTFSVEEGKAVPSVSRLWPAALWQEREAYDLVGVVFEGHPDLRRILLPQDWEGHPLRCDYIFPAAYGGVPLLYQPPDAPL